MAVQFVPPFFDVIRLAAGRPESSGQLALLWLITTACEKNLPLESAVDAMASEARGQWRFKLQDFASILRRGKPLDEAVLMVPDLLPPEAMLAIKVGAANGVLGESLRAEAERQAASHAAQGPESLVGSILYASAMVFLVLTALVFLMIWIVPKFVRIFDDFQVELPETTQSLVSMSTDGVGLLVLGPLAMASLVVPGALLLWCAGIYTPRITLRWLLPRLDVGAVLRQLSVVIAGKQPLASGLHTVSTQHPNTATWKKLSRVYEAVQSGESCWGMMESEKLLTARERYLLESAERSGNLPWALDLVGRQIEDRQDHAVRSFILLLRPMCIAIVGALVGFIAIAIFAPIVKLISDLT